MYQDFADLPKLQSWAEKLIDSREPDFIIGDNYLRRWWIVPRNTLQNVYLHEINKSDEDRAMHDHPWDNTSLLLRGIYIEVTPGGRKVRQAGDVIHRRATDRHRLEVVPGAKVLTLFITGPIVREWGFHCPNGWVHWKDFTSTSGNHSVVGRGCGEE